MRFIETPLAGAYVIDLEPIADERGFFARSWCAEAFAGQGLESSLSQCNISFNAKAGTLRGLHFQRSPHGEAKLVRCTMGSLFDVMVDLRPHSESYGRSFASTLSAENRRAHFIPQGFAHGLQTLDDNTEVFYQMSSPHHAESAGGLRWNDPDLAIAWPEAKERIISSKDGDLPLLAELRELAW